MTQTAPAITTPQTNKEIEKYARRHAKEIGQHRVKRIGLRFSAIAFGTIFLALTVQAQNVQFTQGAVGSGLDNSLSVPLRTYPGRGGTSLPINLYYSSKVWRMRHLYTPGYPTCGFSVVEAIFAEYSTAGWTSSLDIPVLEWPQATDVYGYNGKPSNGNCGNATYGYRIKRVYVHMPDGSTHELRDGDQPYLGYSASQTGTFYAVDGSRMKYVSSTSSLWMPDGSHYEFGSTTTKFIDRNGNTLNYTNSTKTWTDTLGRTLVNPLASAPAEPDDIDYSMPGFNGVDLTYVFHWKHLSDVLAPGVSGTKTMADEYLPTPTGTPTLPGDGNAPAGNDTPSLFQSAESEDAESWTDVVGHHQERGALFDPIVLASIELPNGLSYEFYYNEYAELAKTVYPTGAYDTATYQAMAAIGDLKQPYTQANRGVNQRQLSASGAGSPFLTWTYAVANSLTNQSQVITSTAPDGLVTESERYNLAIPTIHSPQVSHYWPFGYEPAYNGAVYETRTFAPSGMGGAMLRRSLTQTWQSYSTLSARLGSPYDDTVYAYRNARPIKEVSLILDTGGDALAKTMTYTYDTTNAMTTGLDLTVSTESHFAAMDSGTARTGVIGDMTAGSPARSSETTYTTDTDYAARYILGVATESVIKDGGGSVVSRTRTLYDEYTTTAYQLLTYSDLGTTSYTDPGSSGSTAAKRANATTIRRCLDVSSSSSCSSYLETHARFDQVGNVVSTWNERGIETQTEYAINSSGSSNLYHRAYPTKVTTAAPDSSGTHGSTTGFEATTVYDWRTGLVTSATDANGQTSTISYADDSSNLDPLLRPRKTTAPTGVWTKISYHDVVGTPGTTSGLYVKTQSQMDASRVTESYQFFDALGRALRSQTFNGNGYLTVDTQFDSYGRAYRTSNPYTATLDGSVNPSGVWTTITGYDALSRVTQVTLPDSTTVGTAYSGIYTTVTDQAGRERRQKVDALGRIVRVDEPDPGNGNVLGSVDSPYLASYYSYDTLGNLIKIQQGQGSDLQYRYFKYDALGRLTYERQVEATGYFSESDSLTGNSAWSRKLVYDETIGSVAYKGLLTTMCDARNVCSSPKYDQLSRVYEVTYNDSRMPALNNYYDQAHTGYFNKGKLTEVRTASVSDNSGTSWDDSIPETHLKYDFDLMGRTVKSSQTVGSYVYPFEYSYNLGGQMTQEKYPSGRVVNMGYDAVGRLSNLNSGAGHVYVDAFTYAGHGGLSGFTLGNGATISLGYGTNGRLQLSDITLAKNGTTLQKYEYKYGVVESGSVNTAKNTGQLAQVESWIGTEQQYRQQYQYDVLGRVTESTETYGTSLGSTAYDVKYRYDVFGNREQRSSDNSGNSSILQKWVESGDISKSNNHYATGTTYDAAGNITADPRFRNLLYGYDANGRQNYTAQANGSSPTTAIFDGAGQRVAEKAGGALSIMVYDAGGKLAAEYAQVSPPTTGKIEYITNNYQGSTSVVTDRGGAVTSRHDYLPFGEEIGYGVGSRTTAKSFSQGDMMRQKYAGMETDTATGMAHTLWRKDDNLSGRWTSPDPYGGSMSPGEPQTFNRYAYCSNDPVNNVDLGGLYLADIGVYQTENPGVAATLEREISRRVGVLTSPGGIAYQKDQKSNEAKNRKDAAEAKNAQRENSHGRSRQQGTAVKNGSPQSGKIVSHYDPNLNGCGIGANYEVYDVSFDVEGISTETKKVVIPAEIAASGSRLEWCTTGFTIDAQVIANNWEELSDGLQYSISVSGTTITGEVPIGGIIKFQIHVGFAQRPYVPGCPDVPTAPNGGFRPREGSITFSINGRDIGPFEFTWQPTD